MLRSIARRGTCALFQGPRAQQRLIQEIFFIAIRNHLPVHLRFVPGIEFRPAIQTRFPFPGNFGEHIDSRAHILAPFRIVRGAGIHPVRPAFTARTQKTPEIPLGSRRRHLRISAHLIQRQQRVVHVQRRILHAFCHDRTGELLPVHHKRQPRLTLPSQHVRWIRQQQHLAQKIKTRDVEVWFALPRFRQRPLDKFPRFRRHIQAANIRAVRRHARGNLNQRFEQTGTRQFPRIPVLRRQFAELPPQRTHLHAQQRAHHQFFLLVQDIGKLGIFRGEVRVYPLDILCVRRVDKNTVGKIQIFVSRRSADRPVGRQGFAACQDLFHQHVGRRVARRTIGPGQPLLQPRQIGRRILEAIDMIHA